LPVPTLVLPPRFTDDSNALWRAALDAGWDIERLSGWRASEGLARREPVLYGEPLFAAAIAEQLDLALLEPPFDWLTRLPDRYRRREVRFATLVEGRAHHVRAFFKPADDKCFRAGVYYSGDALPSADILPAETPILIAEPVVWEMEFRCFVLERRVTDFSPYARQGELAQAVDGGWPFSDVEREGVLAFSQELCADSDVPLPPAVALDVGVIQGRGWAVVEANPVWGSGIYGCDPSQVLPVLRRACVARPTIGDADREWVIQRGA